MPITADPDALGARPYEHMARQQFIDAFEQRLRPGYEPVREKLWNDIVIHCGSDARGQDRFDLGSKKQFSALDGVIQRLDAKPIARKEQLPAPLIPNRKCKHAPQMLDAIHAEHLIGLEHYFCIAARGKCAASGSQFRAQFMIVVYLSVISQAQALILTGHRLLTMLKVDDRKAPVTEADAPTRVQAFLVGTAVSQDIAHPTQTFYVNRRM